MVDLQLSHCHEGWVTTERGQCSINSETLRAGRDSYRRTLEAKLQQNSVRDVWTWMKHISGMKGKDM